MLNLESLKNIIYTSVKDFLLSSVALVNDNPLEGIAAVILGDGTDNVFRNGKMMFSQSHKR